MPSCRNCDTTYPDDDGYCRWCQYRREELLERLQPDGAVLTLAELAGMAMTGERAEMPERCWRIG